jgi:hypothetical protein
MNRLMWIVGLIGAAGIVRAADDEKKFHPVDLQPQANQKRADSLGSGVEGNNLAKVPGGEQKFGDVKFKIEDGMLHLGSNILDRHPDKVLGIKVDGKCAHLHILHGTCFGGGPNKEGSPLFVRDGTLIGEYRVNYEDKTAVNIPIVYGQDVRDWFYVPDEAAPVRGKIVWSGENDRATMVGAKIRLYLTTWKNPKPDQKILSIDYLGKKEETAAAPFCLAITREE